MIWSRSSTMVLSWRCKSTHSKTFRMLSTNPISPPGSTILQRPSWEEGTNQPPPFANKAFKSYSVESLRKSSGLYKLVISSVIPRPIALVSSQDVKGEVNCAPFSYFNIMSHDPPVVSIGFSHMTKSANHTSGNFPYGENEMAISGLTTLPSTSVKPPRVAESAVQLECEVLDIKPLFNDEKMHSSTVILGRILQFHVMEEVLVPSSRSGERPVVDHEKLQVMSRLGGSTYGTVSHTFDLPRPVVAKSTEPSKKQ